MRRILIILVLLGTAILSLTSCSSGKLNGSETAANASISLSTNAPTNVQDNAATGSSSAATVNTPASSSTSTAVNESSGPDPAGSTKPEASGQNIDTPAEEPAESDLTLEAIKKATQDAGFTVEENKDMQQRVEPKPVDGFIFTYQDESSMSQVPVYEFSSPTDAQAYAGNVNESGYNLCIVSGKFLAVTDAEYGVVLNDKKTLLIETMLKSKVMAYEPAPPQVSQDKDFAGACTRIDAISKALNKLVKKSVLIYKKSLPQEESQNISSISFSLVKSNDMPYLSLSEDQAKMDEVVKTWEYFGCTTVKLKHDAANDYTLTGKRAGMDGSFTIRCVYSPDKDSFRILDKDSGQIAEFYEFIPLGNDKYALQSLYERAIVEYKDGKITSFIYSINTRSKESAYKPDAVGIYPNGTGADEAWVSKAGADKYEQFITFDGIKLKISAVDFTGARLQFEIAAK